MAFSSQFSVALELTNILPIAPALNSAASAAIKLARDLRKSGSDLLVEEDLAAVFGRNRIDDRLESSFRTAVKNSIVLHPLSRLLDIVLEGGAGPTVIRSLQSQSRHYFATVVQLSLLLKTHDLDSLTKAIARAFEKRLAGQDGELLDQTALRGTLKAIRDQTSAFRWDLMLSAVEAKLANQDDTSPYQPYQARPVPFAILQGLLDAFTAVQWFSEQSLLRITTFEGVSTLVVWAHLVLGLVVVVIIDNEAIQFGEGKEQVVIQTCSDQSSLCVEPPSLTLFRSVEESNAVFQITSNLEEDYPLTPVTLHCAGGFGTKLLSEQINDENVIRELAHKIVGSCILLAREANDARQGSHISSGCFSIPTEEKILAAGALLFDNLDYPDEAFLEILDEPCIARCEWIDDNLPAIFLDWLALPSSMRRKGACTGVWRLDRPFQTIHGSNDSQASSPIPGTGPTSQTRIDISRRQHASENDAQAVRPSRLASRLFLQKLIRSLCTLVFAFSFVKNMSECRDMPLSLVSLPSVNFEESYQKSDIGVISIPTALNILANLLLGPSYDATKVEKASIISCWGWSIVLGTINVTPEFPPSLVTDEIAIYQGVPSRKQERKDFVLDGLPNHVPPNGYSKFNDDSWYYKAVAGPGEDALLTSIPIARFLKPYVSIQDSAFEAFLKVQSYLPDAEYSTTKAISLGYREMQNIVWASARLPPCPHPFERLNSSFEVPPNSVTFTGMAYCREAILPEWIERAWVHMGLVAGSSPASWMLLKEVKACKWLVQRVDNLEARCYLRHSECCVKCAVERVRMDPHPHIKILIL